MAIDHEDTWRMWDPHKLEIWYQMETSSYNFESMGSLNVLGWVIRLINFSICIIGRIWEEMQLTWEKKSHFGASETLGLYSLALWQQWWRFYDTYDINEIWRFKYDIYEILGRNISSKRVLMWVGEAQWVPTQIGGKWNIRKGRTHGKS